jgi:hypothetical protein
LGRSFAIERGRGLFHLAKASQVVLSPSCADEQVTDRIRRKGVICPVVRNDDTAAIRMAIDALAALALSELKTLTFEGSDEAAGGDVA